MTSRAEFYAMDRALVARVLDVTGHVEDMPDEERIWLVGALAGALARHLAWAGATYEAAGDLQCPCGEVHELSAAVRAAYDSVTAGKGPTVLMVVNGRGWHVPRIYLAAHGLKAADLPALAEQYGFKEGKPA